MLVFTIYECFLSLRFQETIGGRLGIYGSCPKQGDSNIDPNILESLQKGSAKMVPLILGNPHVCICICMCICICICICIYVYVYIHTYISMY